MRCKDKEHNEFNFLKSAWCPFSHPMTWEESNHSWYGTAMNRLRVCAITGKTVVWNKKCDCIEEYNSRKSDTKRIVDNEERCEICAHFDKICTVTQEGSGLMAVSPMDWCEKFTSQDKHRKRQT